MHIDHFFLRWSISWSLRSHVLLNLAINILKFLHFPLRFLCIYLIRHHLFLHLYFFNSELLDVVHMETVLIQWSENVNIYDEDKSKIPTEDGECQGKVENPFDLKDFLSCDVW